MTSAIVALFVALAAQASAPGVVVEGVVRDQTGGVLSGAHVELVDAAGTLLQTVEADGAGTFRFVGVVPGTYDVRAGVDGFKQLSVRLRVGARRPPALALELELATITQDVTVTEGSASVNAAAGNNADAISVGTDLLDTLPMLDRDLVATFSRFLDPGAAGNGGVTLVVNGMEVTHLDVNASAIAHVKLNQDPYSAEYSRPGRGRIEILTKPGSQKFSGEINSVGRDSRFNARNAFADEKVPEERRIFEGFAGGPLGNGGKTSFTVAANDDRNDAQAFIHAQGLDGVIRDTLPQPTAESRVTVGITHQVSNRNTFSIRPNYTYESAENRGAGGTTLASAATSFAHHEQQVTYNQQTVLTPTLVQQFQMLFGHERETTTSRTADPGIVVAGAFTGGGGQGDLVRTEWHINLNDSVVWIHGRHQVQAGFQLPDWSRRGFFDRTNFGGTFYFANLAAYEALRAYSFTQQQGNGDVVFLEKQVGAYLKDDWQIRPGLTLAYGVRYDWQNYFHDDNNVAPRISLAYAPGNKRTNVVRAGFGLFNDRSGPVVIADVLHSQPGGLTRYVIRDPSYPDPFAAADPAAIDPPSTVRLSPDVQIPQLLQWSVGLDHQLRPTTTVSISYTGSRGYHQFRSRDVNAPPPPIYAVRPDAAFGAIREVESNGMQEGQSITATLRGNLSSRFNGQMQYTLSRAENDTSGIGTFPANDYDLAAERGLADFDRRHRFALVGGVHLVNLVDLGIGVTLNSGGPYTATLGGDVYNNGRGRARPPGVGRNTLETAGFAQLDVRAAHSFKWGDPDARSFTLGLEVFNATNRVNYGTYVGTVSSPLFGQPVSARSPRQLQLSIRAAF